jgi:hypothetical protein
LVIGVGIEPHLKWKTYIKAILDLAHQCQASMVLTLGALLAEVVYSRPVRITGSTTDPELSARLHLNVRTSRYEGSHRDRRPLNDTCRREGLPAVSLWANVPLPVEHPESQAYVCPGAPCPGCAGSSTRPARCGDWP